MAVFCQNLTLGMLSSRSALSVLVGMLFKEFCLFLNTPCVCVIFFLNFTQSKLSVMLLYINFNFNVMSGLHTALIIS